MQSDNKLRQLESEQEILTQSQLKLTREMGEVASVLNSELERVRSDAREEGDRVRNKIEELQHELQKIDEKMARTIDATTKKHEAQLHEKERELDRLKRRIPEVTRSLEYRREEIEREMEELRKKAANDNKLKQKEAA